MSVFCCPLPTLIPTSSFHRMLPLAYLFPLFTSSQSALSNLLPLSPTLTTHFIHDPSYTKVGPYANPQEAYEYYTLPFCAPETEHHPTLGKDPFVFNSLKSYAGIGEQVGGHALRHTGHDLVFGGEGGGHAGGGKGNDAEAPPVIEECTTGELSPQEATRFATAAEDQWFYQMYLDDLPVWGMVGEMLPAGAADEVAAKDHDGDHNSDLEHDRELESARETGEELEPYVYTERTLTVDYNGDQVVKVDLTSDPSSLSIIAPGRTYKFRTFIRWRKTDEPFHSRFDRYLDHAFFKHQIHWFSIFNSFMMVLFLTGLVALILLRTLRRDYAKYALSRDLERGAGEEGFDDDDEDAKGKPLLSTDRHAEESGWKQVHGDVFRAPPLLPLFAALLGTGWQLVALTCGLVLFAVTGPIHGEVHAERGEMIHAAVWVYAFASVAGGYGSGSYFKKYFPTSPGGGGNKKSMGTGVGNKPDSMSTATSPWQLTMALTVILLPTVTVSVLSILNSFALTYGTVNYIPFFAIVKLFFIWIFVSVPLTVLGTLMGRHAKIPGIANSGKGAGPSEGFPCRVNAIPRPMPEVMPWYGRFYNLVPLAGLLSFGSIFIELYYVLTSLWNYKFYHVYGFLLGVYAILIVVVSTTTVIVVYFTLNAEDHRWHWTSFLSGASTAIYIFLYGAYYFFFKTSMNGLLQTAFYFGYTSLIAGGMGTLCGTVGHAAASKFVMSIFRNVKVD